MPLFIKYLAGAITAVVIGFLMIDRSAKTKEDFIKIEGAVAYLEEEFESFPSRDHGDYRYLVVDGTERVFEIFVSNDQSDFGPEFERIDDLQIGDVITLYYDDNSYTEDHLVNSLTRFIDRGEETIFIEDSTTDKTAGYIFIGVGVLMAIIILFLKKKGKIN